MTNVYQLPYSTNSTENVQLNLSFVTFKCISRHFRGIKIKNFRWSNRPDPHEGLPGREGGPCSLVPFQNCPMFPCSHTLSECFRTVIFRILFPCSQKLANVPLFPSIFCQCSPKPLGDPPS